MVVKTLGQMAILGHRSNWPRWWIHMRLWRYWFHERELFSVWV